MTSPPSSAPPSSAPNSSIPAVARIATVVGSYRLERRLGAGGMGEVWLGRHEVSKGVAAVKLLHPRLVARADAAVHFAREQSAILRLSHPHIVPVFEVGEAHIAMAYIDGASLGRRLKAGVAPALVFRIGMQIASALSQAHRRGVLHLDVKPSNILLDAHENAYLADFGAAQLVEEGEEAQGLIAATPAYLSPERANGEPFGPAADQFALGRTLVAALLATEHLPAWGEEPEALPAAIPDDARQVIARALSLDPKSRYPDMAAFAGALSSCHLSGLAPHVTLLPSERDALPFAWADHAAAREAVAPQTARADYSLADLESEGALDAAALARFRDESGLRETGFSLYGHTDSLGPEAGASWLSRARNLVVLVPGYAMGRECWTDVALALVRDNPDTVVAAVDHTGFGDSRYLQDPPEHRHIGYAAVTRTILAWTSLLGLAEMPTVFLGHSLGATGMVLVPDAAFGAHRARILLTPMFGDLARPRPRWFVEATMLAMETACLVPSFYRHYFERRFFDPRKGWPLTDERRRAMIEQAVALPVRTHTRLGRSLGRIVRIHGEGLRRTYFVLGANDPQAAPELCDAACKLLGIRPDRFRWLASGHHYPHLEATESPEGTQRNRHEIVLLVDEALAEARQTRSGSTEFAKTELA